MPTRKKKVDFRFHSFIHIFLKLANSGLFLFYFRSFQTTLQFNCCDKWIYLVSGDEIWTRILLTPSLTTKPWLPPIGIHTYAFVLSLKHFVKKSVATKQYSNKG